jgi:anti-sigma B factor antagonist
VTHAGLDIHVHGGALVISARGEIDMSNAAMMRSAIEARLLDHDARTVIFDLSGVAYLDSAGIQLVYQLAQRLEQRGLHLRLVVPPGSLVAETLRYANASTLVPTSPTLAAALPG